VLGAHGEHAVRAGCPSATPLAYVPASHRAHAIVLAPVSVVCANPAAHLHCVKMRSHPELGRQHDVVTPKALTVGVV
jgi:hypothetical protein